MVDGAGLETGGPRGPWAGPGRGILAPVPRLPSPGIGPIVGMVLIAAAAAGCGTGGADGEPGAASAPDPSPVERPQPTGGPASSAGTSAAPTAGGATPATGTAAPGGAATPPGAGADVDARLEAARQDLARRFGYDPAEVRLVGVEPVTWRDRSLGCPTTDGTYDPGPVEGYRMEVARKDVVFRYHGAAGELPFLCQYLD